MKRSDVMIHQFSAFYGGSRVEEDRRRTTPALPAPGAQPAEHDRARAGGVRAHLPGVRREDDVRGVTGPVLLHDLDGVDDEVDQLSPEDAKALLRLTLHFAREMTRLCCSGDAVFLAARAAQAAVKPTEKQLKQFVKAVSYEYARRQWPKGF